MAAKPPIQRLALIGVGLIGGSLARALRDAGQVGEVVGHGRNESALKQAVALGVIDRYSLNIGAAVAGADMVVVAVPVGAMQSVFTELADHLKTGAVLTDVGSSKQSVVDAAERAFGEIPPWFVPAHPIAGIEKSGVEASFAGLFQGRRVILTPLENTDRGAIERVKTMWQAAGAIVDELSVSYHDEVLAATSHLPHLLAFALVDTLAGLHDKQDIFRFAAGGFRDFTRIASSDPLMWHDICLSNRQQVLGMLDLFMKDLRRLEEAIEKNDSQYLLEVFTRAKQARDQFNR